MKTKYFILPLALCAFALLSCENDDNTSTTNQLVESTFTGKYPSAAQVNWERKGDYSVADFRAGNNTMEAWINQSGVWYMTETDILFDALPVAIKNAFLASEYQTWRIDDIDMVERKDMETIYVIEVESGNQEHDLYYSANGTLIKVVSETNRNDDNERYLPSAISNTIKDYISTSYPQARILEIENERGMVEVDIIDGNVHRELMFKADGSWVHTKTDIRKSDVPQTVLNALAASTYASYTIDDIHYYVTPQRNYYYFELESRSQEVELIISAEGNIEVVKVSND